MRFLHPERDQHLELSLDDVFLVPGCFEGQSRMDVDLAPADFAGGSHPVVSANMNGVTGKRMAETMARFGGLGVLPQDMELATLRRIVGHIKAADPRYDTALTVTLDATLRDVEGIMWKRAHGMVVVVDGHERPIGVITTGDTRDKDQYTPASELMSREVVTLPEGATNRQAFDVMERNRIKAAPIVGDSGQVLGVLTRDDTVRLDIMPPSTDKLGRLMVGAALGISSDVADRAVALVEMGVDVLVLDTAHGHQSRMVQAVREVRAAVDAAIPLVAGNVCTAEGTRALIEAGADVVKVNVGPGAMCTTRMQTGVGRPTFSSVKAAADEARKLGRHVWADGGVRHPRDVALYLAAGASRVMVGTWLAGTYESPGDLKEDEDGRRYKVNWGMASARAVRDRSSNLSAFEQAKKGFFREGISHSRIYLSPGHESVSSILVDVITGVRSTCTYLNAASCDDLHDNALVGVQSAGGFTEGTPHGRVRN